MKKKPVKGYKEPGIFTKVLNKFRRKPALVEMGIVPAEVSPDDEPEVEVELEGDVCAPVDHFQIDNDLKVVGKTPAYDPDEDQDDDNDNQDGDAVNQDGNDVNDIDEKEIIKEIEAEAERAKAEYEKEIVAIEYAGEVPIDHPKSE